MTEENKKDELLNFLWEISNGDYEKDLKQKARRLYLLHSEKPKSGLYTVKMENFSERFIVNKK